MITRKESPEKDAFRAIFIIFTYYYVKSLLLAHHGAFPGADLALLAAGQEFVGNRF